MLNIIKNILVWIGLFLLMSVPSIVMELFLSFNKSQGQAGLSWWQMAVVVLVLFLILSLYLFLAKGWHFWSSWKDISLKRLVKVTFLGFLAIIVVNIVSNLVLSLSGTETTVNQSALMELFNEVPSPIFFLLVVVLAPITEEIVFRGVIVKCLFAKKESWGYFASVPLFALAHTPTDIGSWIAYAGMGTVLAFVYWKMRKLEYSIALHMFNNCFSFVGMLLVTLIG